MPFVRAGLALVVLGAHLLPAQQAIMAGDRVRITASGLGTREAELLQVRVDTIRLRDLGPGTRPHEWSVLSGQVQRFEVHRLDGGTRAPAGILLGAVAGGALIGTIGYALTTCESYCGGENGVGVVLSVPGAILGGVIGGLIGKRARKAGWVRVNLPLRSVSIGHNSGSTTLSTRASF